MSYAGDLSPQQTWERLESDPQAVLVDVRTRAEWAFVGRPDLSSIGKEPVTIEWLGFPGGVVNEDFLGQLEAAGVGRDQPVYFLCRSGARSVAAATAAAGAGWSAAHNITEGFEGQVGPGRHRDVDGWRNAGLPWWQG